MGAPGYAERAEFLRTHSRLKDIPPVGVGILSVGQSALLHMIAREMHAKGLYKSARPGSAALLYSIRIIAEIVRSEP